MIAERKLTRHFLRGDDAVFKGLPWEALIAVCGMTAEDLDPVVGNALLKAVFSCGDIHDPPLHPGDSSSRTRPHL